MTAKGTLAALRHFYKRLRVLASGNGSSKPSVYMSGLALSVFAFGKFPGVVLAVLASVAYGFMEQNRSKPAKPLSPFVLVQLANGAYRSFADPLPVLGWSRLKRYSQQNGDNAGPCIDVFYHKSDKVLVLSVRGTDPSFLGDLTQDLKLFHDRIKVFVEGDGRHQLPNYAMDLVEIMKEWEDRYEDCQLYLTGHSLGAACCEAAWLADVSLKSKLAEKQQESGLEPGNYRLWRCVTWESPGFAINTTFREVLNKHRDTLDTHVVHYLGAPNVINCLHPHISTNRRYRIFLEHDNRLTCWHVIGCLWRDAVVVMNWICVARAGAKVAASFLVQAGEAAEIAAAAATNAPPFSMRPRALMKYCGHQWHRFLVTPTCPDAGANLRAVADVFASYDRQLGNAQTLLSGWFKNIMPIGDGLTWSIVRGNALMQGKKAVEYLLRQHSLMNHIDSFDVRSGYPLRWVQVESWPSLSQMISRTLAESVRATISPNSLTEHVNPAVEIENKIQRLSGYKERRRFTADRQVLKDHYNYLGDGYFDDIMAGFNTSLNVLEELCREEYRRCNRPLPPPVYIVG